MILITGGIVHIGNGSILDHADILISDGKIIEVGVDICKDKATEVVDAKGMHILPGFIDPMNVWGVLGPSFTDKDSEEHSDPVVPHMDTYYAFDYEGLLFQKVYEYGVTTVGVIPSTKNVFGGSISVFKTYGDTPSSMLVKKKAAILSSVTKDVRQLFGRRNLLPMTKMGIFALIKKLIKDTESYMKKEDAPFDMKLSVFSEVLNGDLQLFVNCNTLLEQEQVKALFGPYPIKITFTGTYDLIEGSKEPVILGDKTMAMNPYSVTMDYDMVNRELALNRVIAVGNTGDVQASGKESLLWNGLLAYSNGISSENVIEMMTMNPAKILGIDAQLGSIEEGKDADIVLWTHHPIESFEARVEKVFINGENVLNMRRELQCW